MDNDNDHTQQFDVKSGTQIIEIVVENNRERGAIYNQKCTMLVGHATVNGGNELYNHLHLG
jgi:hypothetical protein